MRHFSSALLVATLLPAMAQDTTVVHTLTFDSITTRRGWWEFPPASEQYRKVLMVHTLKCDPQTTQDQFDCGEWDYLTYHFVHEHTGVLDSNTAQHPYFKVGTTAPDSVWSMLAPGFHQHQRWQRSASIDAVANNVLGIVGSADTADAETFITFKRRSQYLYLADELSAAGLVAGPIHELRFNVVSGSAFIERCTVRMKNTTDAAIDRFDDQGLITVYDRNLNANTLHLVLSQPFLWDGTSNVLVDVANENEDVWSDVTIEASLAGAGTALREIGLDDAVRMDDDFIGIDPAPLAALSDAVTITFRTFGAPQLPLNTTVLEAVNADGQRVLNIHLPWSNGRIYWDAGNQGSAYDRIDKEATESEYEGSWTDWAFVKNAATGSMKVYKNGVLWHTGTGKTMPMDGIVHMRVGSAANGSIPYPGMIDGLNIFASEVSAATIAAWHDRKTTSAHPDFASLLYSVEMDEGTYSGLPYAQNAVNADAKAWLMGTVQRVERPAMELFRNATDPGTRPVIIFGQGDYTISIDSLITSSPYNDCLPQLSREYFAVQGNSVVPVDTVFGRSAGWTRVYAPDGTLIDSTYGAGTLHVNDTLNYFATPFEVINNHEIGRYITPYGIGLDLGDDGFSWVYDVTDYQHLLHDSVELSAGNQQELIDLTYLMIEGDAPRPVVNVQRPWGPMGSYSYAGLSNDTQLPPVGVGLYPGATQWMLRSRLTGHGHNSNDGEYPHCCEWKDNTHYLSANGQQIDQWHIWQEDDCANNPVYPQSGTWPGSREGWCPGDRVKDRDTELTPYVLGDSITIDYAITPVPLNNLGMGGGNYVINMDLFEFGPASHALDAEIYNVRRPNDAGLYSRENPICYDPVLVLRNAGSTVLTSVNFEYRVSGGQLQFHTWTGSLAHMAAVEVHLPVPNGDFWEGDGQNNFEVKIGAVNGAAQDDYAANDHYTTHFDIPVVYPANFVVWYKSNNRPSENDLFIRDINGQVVFSRTTHTANTVYRDTLELPDGCYELEFTDAGNDGLSYWADPDAGNGYFRFRSLTNQTLRNFEPEFGHRIHAAFGIGTITSIAESVGNIGFEVMPNPGTGQFHLAVAGVQGTARIDVFDGAGTMVHSFNAELTGDRRMPLDLTQQPDGLYLIRLAHERGVAALRVLKQ